MMRKRLALVAPLLMCNAAPIGSPTAVFGIEVGQPVHLPECSLHRFEGGATFPEMYEQIQAVMCYERDIQPRDAPWRRGWIEFPPQQAPLILHGHMISYFVVDGLVAGLHAETLDRTNTDAIMRELTEKFGRPTSVENGSRAIEGIEVPLRVARWRLPWALVEYRNVGEEISFGTLMVMTPAFERLRDAHDRADLQARTPL